MKSLAVLFAPSIFALLGATWAGPTTFALAPQHGSHERGTVFFVRRNDGIAVDVRVTGISPGEASQLVHIHRDACDRISLHEAIDLEPLVNGRSRTTLRGEYAKRIIAGGAFYVSVHKTLANITAHVACGGPLHLR